MKLRNLSLIIIILFTSYACQKNPMKLHGDQEWVESWEEPLAGNKRKIKYTAPLTFSALITGTMIGKTIGGAIDDVDEMKLKYALNKLPDDHSLSWDNPNTNNK